MKLASLLIKIKQIINKIPQLVWLAIILLSYHLIFGPIGGFSAKQVAKYQNDIVKTVRANEQAYRDSLTRTIEVQRAKSDSILVRIETLKAKNKELDVIFNNQLKQLKYLQDEANFKIRSYGDSTIHSLLKRLQSEY